MHTLTSNQYNYIQGFFAHLWAVKWDGAKADFGFWAKQLDSLGVSWYIQNSVSALVDKRESGFLYLRPQLAKFGISVSQDL